MKEMDQYELLDLDGGIAVAGACALASGVCYLASGIAACTGHDKIAAGLTIAGGVCDVAAGISMLLP